MSSFSSTLLFLFTTKYTFKKISSNQVTTNRYRCDHKNKTKDSFKSLKQVNGCFIRSDWLVYLITHTSIPVSSLYAKLSYANSLTLEQNQSKEALHGPVARVPTVSRTAAQVTCREELHADPQRKHLLTSQSARRPQTARE